MQPTTFRNRLVSSRTPISRRPSSISAIAVLALFASAATAGVLRVPGDAPTVQDAIDAAAELDTILVSTPSSGACLVSGKSLTLVADGVTVAVPHLSVENLGPEQTVVVRGFSMGLVANGAQGALVRDNAGSVRMEECSFRGSIATLLDGHPGLRIEDCASVLLSRCSAIGGAGADLWDEDFDDFTGDGGAGILVRTSQVVVSDCTFTGGRGGNVNDTDPANGGRGGDGLHNKSGFVVVTGSHAVGGRGGQADCDLFNGCGNGGDGGSGVRQEHASASLWVRDNTYDPGAGGLAWPPGFDGLDGLDEWIQAGPRIGLPTAFRGLSSISPVREGETTTLTFTGQPGDGVFLWISLLPGHVPLLGREGVFLIGPAFVQHLPLGALGAGGVLALPLTMPELGPGIAAVDFHFQSVFDAAGSVVLGPTTIVTALDDGL